MKTPFQKDWWTERRAATALSLAAAWAFFAEYLPPFQRVHLIWDFDGFHHPLLNDAFQRLRAGGFPEWDPTIYCGAPFAGNIQVGLFYPGTWLLFLANWTRTTVSFASAHVLVAAHFALALLFTFLWLREIGTGRVAAALGAASFAFSGFFLNEVQHLGATEQTAWIAFTLWGLAEASRRRTWLPLWKVALGSALAFLAGFPFVWAALVAAAIVYAATLPGRRWLIPGCAAAIGFSVLLAMVQILPAREAALMKVARQSFGFGRPHWRFLPPFFAPNYYNNSRLVDPKDEQWYFYLGGVALFALLWWIRRGGLRKAAPGLALAGAALLIMFDPGRLIAKLLILLAPAHQMVRDWNFLALFPIAAALIVAAALNDFLSKKSRATRPALAWIAPIVMSAWIVRQLTIWRQAGDGFLSGWASLWEAAAVTALVALGLWTYRGERRPAWRAALLVALVLFVLVDYKVYGTNRSFDAAPGDRDRQVAHSEIGGGPERPGLEQKLHERMRADRTHRYVHNENPSTPDIRYYKPASPQGSDPIFPETYRLTLERAGAKFTADRTFTIPPANTALLQNLGVRYYLTHRHGEFDLALRALPRFRLLGQEDSFYALYEYLDAEPIYHWRAGAATCTEWTPETRAFTVDSAAGGGFALSENRYPGWSATVDGQPAAIRPWAEVFQQITVPPGRREVRFHYRTPGLRAGALISLGACAALLAVVYRDRRSKRSRPGTATAG